jgi:3-oxoacyl-(acyl-carrier-protein) synthase
MAGRFPGADDVREFWDNLVAGRKSVGQLPPEILGTQTRGYRWGGVITDRDCFDAEFFGIDPREADSMNLHQRLLLQEAWHAMEDAGIDPLSLSGSDTGMFVGAEPAGYLHESFTGASDALVAARLSYFLDWHGPALVVNTACSSSVVAIHLACQSLLAGECDLALAAGANAGLSAQPLDLLADMGVLSASGECRAFDNSANGTVFAEGVAVVVLKRLADAEAAGDDIRGVIRATGVNSDGASNGITAPNGLAQERLIDGVYRRYGIDASRIGYVEAHGTGTALGDPVEAGALVRVFGRYQPNPAGCVLGTAKANIGHTGAAAGVIGLVKVLLSLRNERLTGMPTFRTLNPMIKLDGSGITVDSVGRPWPATPGVPRLAAVNSMGHSGTNAHLVVEEYLPAPRPASPTGVPVAVPLSARNVERLAVLAGELADHLDRVCAPRSASGADILRDLIADLLGIAASQLQGARTLEGHGAEPHQLARLAILLAKQTGRQVTVDDLYAAPSVDSLVTSLAPAVQVAEQPLREPPTVADVAVTLQQGRAALDERAVVVARTTPELVAALRALAAGRPTADTVTGRAGGTTVYPADGSLPALARAWCDGGAVSWPTSGGRRVPLPGYPFARVRHGKDRLAPRPATPAPAVAATPAPAVAATPVPEPAFVVPPAVDEPYVAGGVGQLHEDVAGWLTGVIADEVGIEPGAIDRWERFDAYGVDSVVRTRVNHRLADQFPSASRTLLFEFATIAEVADMLATDFPADCRGLRHDAAATPAGDPVDTAPVGAGVDVVAWLSGVVADEAGIDPGGIDPWQPWDAFGIDSVVRTRVNHRISTAFPDASRTLLFEFGTIAEVAQGLAADFPTDTQRLAAEPTSTGTVPRTPVPTGPVPDWPVAPAWAAPFPEREIGFSASRVLLDPDADPDDTDLVRERQAELLDVLLHGENLDRVGGLIDLHGVPGAAGLRLAARHVGLRVHIRATDPAQADAAMRAAKEHRLDARVTVEHNDTVLVESPYEVAVGIEGSHLVADKSGYLAGVAAALPEGGRLLLAEFLAVDAELADHRIGVVLPTTRRWADLLADAGFVLGDAVDASAQVGHFFADFDVDQNTAGLDPVTKGRWRFHTDLAVPLERGKAAYLLLRLRKDTTTDPAARRAANQARIAATTPYTEAVTRR